jgi:hypothetical protein
MELGPEETETGGSLKIPGIKERTGLGYLL